jgi:site-specific DNA recombinase
MTLVSIKSILIQSEIVETERRLERLYDAVETGKIPLADLAPRIHELRLRNEKLQERKIQVKNLLSDRKVELASPEIVKSYVKDMRRILEESELTSKRAFLKGFIKRIEVVGREGIIHYLLPINGVLEEKIGVLPIVHYGGPWLTVPELLFEKKQLIPALQQLLISIHELLSPSFVLE